MKQASQIELNKFVRVVDEFKAKYARLILPSTRADIYRSNNSELISNYESAVMKSGMLNSTINATVGAWGAYKRGVAVTSTVIGDAIDTVRGWFGYDASGGIGNYSPGLGQTGLGQTGLGQTGLGAIQLVGAAAIAGIIGTAVVLNKLITQIFVSLEANKLQRENPGMDRFSALKKANASVPSLFPTGITPVMLGMGAIAFYLIFGGKRNG